MVPGGSLPSCESHKTKNQIIWAFLEIQAITHGYGLHEDEKFSFLGFFQFLVSRREMGDEKREIDFLHFLPNFGQILALFEDFSKYNQHFHGF